MKTPSIGSVGLTIDDVNKRVKVLCAQKFNCVNEAQEFLTTITLAEQEGCALLERPDARFTSRVLLPVGTPQVPEFSIGKLLIREEARIHANGLDLVYLGGNSSTRFDSATLTAEIRFSVAAAVLTAPLPEPEGEVVFEHLRYPVSVEDVMQLLEMYQLCFTSYPVLLDETLIQTAAENSIFFVARNRDGKIVASAIGESLRVGPVTLLEVSEEAAHPILRIKGAASGCARRTITEGKKILSPPVIAFWEARMWRNILGMGSRVGLTEFGGVLHQHCRISSSAKLTSLPNPSQGKFGSLAVFYAP